VYLAEDFVQAADENQLDWRLLPSISVIESGGGKAYRNNNIFGWNNGATLFPSIRAGLNEVAYKLSHSPLYRNRDIPGKLRLYNPDESYAGAVVSVMNRISPVVNLRRVNRTVSRQSQLAYATD
ncbi:MAG: glucosaminidase domain-containing protein, partial [Acidobacteriaceae bacterium]|nr:glucosaminidase domain-containing protein [Acidobacteriaceae bacterium]